MKKFDTIDAYFEGHPKWQSALAQLRELILTTELYEAFKWKAPVYTLNNKNVVGLAAFKNHFGIWFFNGVFLKDDLKVLEQTSDTTKALRQMRFNEDSDIDMAIVKAYILEAIENEKQGKIVPKPAKSPTLVLPDILKAALKADPDINTQFKALTPYKQREYADHIATAKRDKTKQNRLEKIIPLIKQGVGLNDKYKNC